MLTMSLVSTMMSFSSLVFSSSTFVDAFGIGTRPRRISSNIVTVPSSFHSILVSNNHHPRTTTTRLYQVADDFDQTKYTDAAWSAIAALPAAADVYSATSVDAPMLLAILLNPTKYQAGENALTARQVVVKLLQDSVGDDASFDIDNLRSDVESYLNKQPKVSGTGSDSQKRMGRTLADVLKASRDVRDGLQDSYISTEALLLGLCAKV